MASTLIVDTIKDSGETVEIDVLELAGAKGRLVGFSHEQSNTAGSGTAKWSNTVQTAPPIITEGTEIDTITHTPKKAGNKLIVEYTGAFSADNGNTYTVALFDGSNDAIKAAQFYGDIAGAEVGNERSIRAIVTAANTDPITFSLRGGAMYIGAGVTFYWNRTNTYASQYGAANLSDFTVKEVEIV